MVKKIRCYDFAIKYIKNENNIGADALNRKPDYKNPNKLVKPMLIKNGNYKKLIKITEKNENIIRDAHDIKLIGYQKVLKTLKKKTTWKNIKADVKSYVKITQFA